MDILKRAKSVPFHHQELGRFTTLKDRHVEFSVVELCPYNMDLRGLLFKVRENKIDVMSVCIWYTGNWANYMHNHEDGKIKDEYLKPIFSALKEAVFYEKIEEEELEIMLGEENPLGLKYKKVGETYEVISKGHDDYQEHLYQRIAYEICMVLKKKYLDVTSFDEIKEQVWFPSELIEKLLRSIETKESLFWDYKRQVGTNEIVNIKLTDSGREFVKNYKSPLDILQPEADLEAVKSTIFTPPEFLFIADEKIRDILKRDWVEIQKSLRDEVKNWKSAIILCGGVLEAVLYDILQQQKAEAKTSRAKLALTDKGISPKTNIGSWNLYTLIAVATDLKLISNIGEGFTAALRDYRNLIHPRKEAMGNYKIREHEANVSFHALQAIVDDLEENVESIG